MRNELTVVTIVGTRPELIRLSRVIARLDESTNHVLVHTGQNYSAELRDLFLKDLEIRQPDVWLEAAEESPSKSIAKILAGVDDVLAKISPDALLVLGDTNSCLGAYAAKRRQIPVFHMEAGNRCFDQRTPEELNRRLIDHMADMNLTYSNIARSYLLAEGFPADRIIKTGSPMLEVLQHYWPKIESSTAVQDMGLHRGGYFLVSAHREENIDSDARLESVIGVFNHLCTRGLPVVVSTHPRLAKRLSEASFPLNSLVRLERAMSFSAYVRMQIDALAVVSDSGTISEEADILGLRAVNLRETHERPEAMEEAVVPMSGLDISRVDKMVNLVSQRPMSAGLRTPSVGDYNVVNVSEKIVRIIYSYVDYVRRTVWRTQSI